MLVVMLVVPPSGSSAMLPDASSINANSSCSTCPDIAAMLLCPAVPATVVSLLESLSDAANFWGVPTASSVTWPVPELLGLMAATGAVKVKLAAFVPESAPVMPVRSPVPLLAIFKFKMPVSVTRISEKFTAASALIQGCLAPPSAPPSAEDTTNMKSRAAASLFVMVSFQLSTGGRGVVLNCTVNKYTPCAGGLRNESAT